MYKLLALTSLRFVAAIAIVIHHLPGNFDLGPWGDATFPLAQSVSFFFVLSGFIMVYVYPKLDNIQDYRKFYLARVARIWPGHLIAFILTVLLIGNLSFQNLFSLHSLKLSFLNIFLIHSWWPSSHLYFSFNSPSWSISTEFFFYLCYPFLIYRWNSTYLTKLVVSLLILIAMFCLCIYFNLPNYKGIDNSLNSHGILYINPLSRIFDFILGMNLALFWVKYNDRINIGVLTGTLVELLVCTIVLLNMHFTSNIITAINHFLPLSLQNYFMKWGDLGFFSLFSFCLLIFTFACEKGMISKILSMKIPVVLGEISFTIYLFHNPIFLFFKRAPPFFTEYPLELKLMLFFCSLFLCSYLLFFYVELPIRKYILAKANPKQIASTFHKN